MRRGQAGIRLNYVSPSFYKPLKRKSKPQDAHGRRDGPVDGERGPQDLWQHHTAPHVNAHSQALLAGHRSLGQDPAWITQQVTDSKDG